MAYHGKNVNRSTFKMVPSESVVNTIRWIEVRQEEHQAKKEYDDVKRSKDLVVDILLNLTSTVMWELALTNNASAAVLAREPLYPFDIHMITLAGEIEAIQNQFQAKLEEINQSRAVFLQQLQMLKLKLRETEKRGKDLSVKVFMEFHRPILAVAATERRLPLHDYLKKIMEFAGGLGGDVAQGGTGGNSEEFKIFQELHLPYLLKLAHERDLPIKDYLKKAVEVIIGSS